MIYKYNHNKAIKFNKWITFMEYDYFYYIILKF